MASPNATLTEAQRHGVAQIRAALRAFSPPNTAETVEVRARRPDPETIPADVTVHVEIAPPSDQPHPLLLATRALKTPERVPIYLFSLSSESAESQGTSTVEGPDPPRASTLVIFFIHGGGNVVGHPTHAPFVQFYVQLLRAVRAASPAQRCVLIAPSYRLATVPENVFPAALQDLVAAYDHVLGLGYDPAHLVVAGDSAGGNHALVLTHLVLQSNRPPPRGVVTIAPGATRAHENVDAHLSAFADKDILDLSSLKRWGSMYVGDSGASREDPLVLGTLIPFAASWPKTLILVGTHDHFIDLSRELERRLKARDRPVELVEYNERPHGWWVYPHVFPENIQDAVERIAQFILH